MKYLALDLAIRNTKSPDTKIADAAIAFIDAHDAIENARLALDRANERLIDALGNFLSLIGQ
jgi:poly-gamma-glutamate capsule biosynthesis protein CapA/YwtB (metallophosphatase superfamily)